MTMHSGEANHGVFYGYLHSLSPFAALGRGPAVEAKNARISRRTSFSLSMKQA
jgi:hypothetical protein